MNTSGSVVYFGIGVVIGLLLTMAIFAFFGTSNAEAQEKSQDSCKVYSDKAKELAEKSERDLPAGITIYFDPRIAESNDSIAYSQIYRNCKEYGE